MRTLTIRKKLSASFGAALALTLIISVVALRGFSGLGGQVRKLVGTNSRKLYLAGDIDTTTSGVIAGERGILLRAYMNDYATVDTYKAQQLETFARLKEDVDEFAPLVETAEGRQLITKVQDAQITMGQDHAQLVALVDKHDLESASKVYADKVMPDAKLVNKTAEALMTEVNELTVKVGESVEDSVAQSRWITIIVIALSLLVGLVVAFIVRQIDWSLRQTISELTEGAEQVASAATQVSSSSQALAQGSSELAASLEESSASSEEINSMARKNTENSRSAADLVAFSQQKFVETNQSLEQTVMAMGNIKSSSDRIANIIKTIDEIAFQTNILALNAAVEAARAGEAGMGFAVVADEVRTLAQRCAQAAKDTAALIEESIAKSNDGKSKVDEVAEAIRAVTHESDRVKALVDEVNMGSQEQARGIEQIARVVTQMEQVTQNTAASAEESASAAEELNAQSETLKDIIGRLSVMIGGVRAENGSVGRRKAVVRSTAAVQQRSGASASSFSPLRTAVAHKR